MLSAIKRADVGLTLAPCFKDHQAAEGDAVLSSPNFKKLKIDYTQSEHGKVRAANNCKNGEKHYS
jgi:hypothetical protein